METKTNVSILQQEMDWLQAVIDQAIKTYLLQDGHEDNWLDIELPDLEEIDCPYANAVKNWDLDIYNRLALALAMAPHVRPELMDIFLGKNQVYDRGFTEFGGVLDKGHSGFLPTGQTLNFLITVSDTALMSVVNNIFGKNSILIKEDVLSLTAVDTYLPRLNGILSLNNSWFNYFLTGEQLQVEQSAAFPAQKITTAMDWEDLVLDDQVMHQVTEINTWIKHGETLMNDWGLFKKIKPGYRTLFYGPPRYR